MTRTALSGPSSCCCFWPFWAAARPSCSWPGTGAGGVFLGILTLIYLAFLIHGLIAKPKPSKRGWNSYFDKPPKKR